MSPEGLRRYLVLVVVMAGTSMVMLDLAVVNVALPTIMVSLGTNVVEARWIVTAFMLVSSLVMPLTGWLGRRFGYGTLWIAALGLFTTGTALCAASTSLEMLIAARIIQALGAGFIQSTDMAIITTTFPPDQRGRAIGLWGIALSLGPMIGPTTAGYLVENFNWQSVFMLNLPLGVVAIVSSLAVLDRTTDDPPPPLDWSGYLGMTAFMTASLLTLDQGNQVGWHAEIIKLGLLFSAATFAAVLLVEWNHDSALIPLRLFRNSDFSIAVLISFIRSTGMFASFFLQPLFLQQIQGHDPIMTGLLLVPASISFTVAMPVAGVLADRFGGRWPTVIGAIIAGWAYVLYWDLDYRTSDLNVIIPQMLRGIGMSLIVTPSMTAGLGAVAKKDVGTASWIINIAQRFGGAITVAMLANFHYTGTLAELDRLGRIGPIVEPGGGSLADAAHELGHSATALSDVTRSLHMWDAGQAAATLSYDNLFTGTGIILFFIVIPALFMSSRKRVPQRNPGG